MFQRRWQVLPALLCASLIASLPVPGAGEERGAAPVEGMNRFATSLYAELCPGKGNLFFSPASISVALAMPFAGARGDTAAEMEKVLHYDWPGKEPVSVLSSLMENVQRRAVVAGCQLDLANAAWLQTGLRLLPRYESMMKRHFAAGLREVDFTASETARKTINDWVSEATRAKIRDLIPPGLLTELTRLVLTNAIYFKGTWAEPFEKEMTRDEPFTTAEGKKVDVPMMNMGGHLRYADLGDLQALELPYRGSALAMVVLLPGEGRGLGDLEKSLAAGKLGDWLSKLAGERVQVHLPRFRVEGQFQVEQPLVALGMRVPFTADADFSGMTGKRDLFLSSVIHKTYVDVTEEGTEAAAATAVAVAAGAPPSKPPPVFRADHPFIFLIRDLRTGWILFLGRLCVPQKNE